MKNIDEQALIIGGIFALSNKLQTVLNKIYKELTIKQWFLIAVISKFENPPSLNEVSQIMGVSYQNVKKMATILQNDNFISIQKDENDARILRLILTEKSINYCETTAENELYYEKLIFENFTPEQISHFCNGITTLDKNLDKIGGNT